MKKTITPEVRKYFQEIGRKRGLALKEKYGSDYFKQLAAKRKTFGRKPMRNSIVELAKRFGVSRQRLYQVIKSNGNKFNKADYTDNGMWREAVLSDFFENK